jgi:hypothetical protein
VITIDAGASGCLLRSHAAGAQPPGGVGIEFGPGGGLRVRLAVQAPAVSVASTGPFSRAGSGQGHLQGGSFLGKVPGGGQPVRRAAATHSPLMR